MAAKRRSKTAPKRSRKPAKPAKAAKPKKSAKAVDEPDKPGMPVEVALSIITGVFLIAAFFLVDYERGVHYGEGLFFKGSYSASAD